LAGDVSIGEPHDEAMLGRVILVLVLCHKTFPGIIICLALWEQTGERMAVSFSNQTHRHTCTKFFLALIRECSRALYLGMAMENLEFTIAMY